MFRVSVDLTIGHTTPAPLVRPAALCKASSMTVKRTDSAPPKRETVKRYDFQTIPTAGVAVGGGGRMYDASLTQVGIFEYDIPGRGIVRELRPAEEVFKDASIASANHVTLTRLHPPTGVNPHNWGTVSIGAVSGPARQDGNLLKSPIIVRDASALKDVAGKDLTEISMGYDAWLDWTPGEWEGQHYDCIQRDILYNHAALGPSNWGRMGNACVVRLDGMTQAQLDSREKDQTVKKYIIDGVEYEAGTPAFEEAMAKREKRHQDAAELATKEATLQRTEDAATIKKLQEDSAKAARAKVVQNAVRVSGKPAAHFDGKDSAAVMSECIKLHDSGLVLDGHDAAHLGGMFAMLPAHTPKTPSAATSVVGQVPVKVEDTADAARAAMIKDSDEAWRQPLLFSKKGSS